MNRSDLDLQLEAYLALRRALGFAMRAEESLLRDFVRFVQVRGLAGPIPAYLAVDWVCSTASPCGPARQVRRLSVVRGFLAHVRAAVPETQIPEPHVLAAVPRVKPYIYSQTELQKLLEAAAALGPKKSLRPHTYTALIGLLARTGLRVGEALRLTVSDVHLYVDPAVLEVRQTKFRKSRIVAVHATTAERLRQYAEPRTRLGRAGLSEAFFVSQQEKPLGYDAVWRTFITLGRRVGLKPATGGRRPSLHGLRHTFAVGRLLLWYQEGVDVRARLPHLSVYMGHARPEATYWYLTATPALLSAAAQLFETYAESGGDL